MEAFGQGLQRLAVVEAERLEITQLSEPFGEWRVRPSRFKGGSGCMMDEDQHAQRTSSLV